MSAVFDEKIQTTLADSKLQLAICTATGRLIEKRRKAITPDICPDYQELRTHANAVKRHTIEHLDYYLEGVARETVIEKQTMIARAVLREKFLSADIGVSGANFLVADSGAVVLVENEGNARLTTSAPKIHIAVAGIEKMIPRAQDLGVFLQLLGRSGTGQLLSVYTSFLSGPRRGDEIDGPDEFYVVLLDNGRTKVLADREKRESPYSIRVGACLTH